MKIAGIAIAALLLTGCATERLNSSLQRVIGQPIDILVSAWGYPAGQREMMGHTIYVWSNDGGAMAVPMYGGGVFAARLQCQVQVSVDDRRIVRSYQWSGNNGGCAAFARRLP
jgi:hypothetical protein